MKYVISMLCEYFCRIKVDLLRQRVCTFLKITNISNFLAKKLHWFTSKFPLLHTLTTPKYHPLFYFCKTERLKMERYLILICISASWESERLLYLVSFCSHSGQDRPWGGMDGRSRASLLVPWLGMFPSRQRSNATPTPSKTEPANETLWRALQANANKCRRGISISDEDFGDWRVPPYYRKAFTL